MTHEPTVDTEGLAPLKVRVRFSHAAVEWVAREAGVPSLHVKGPAADPRLRDSSRYGSDADVIVCPEQSEHHVDMLVQHGWDLRARFRTGSIFEHAATLWHEHWGYVDVHRTFPGVQVDGGEAFNRLWADRQQIDLAGFTVNVPSVEAQALLLVLHAARERLGDAPNEDVRRAWLDADPELRDRVAALRDELRAEVAFAAATGDLERFKDRREYRLWWHMRHGGTRLDEWRARIAAAPSTRRAVVLALRALTINEDHLAMSLGHTPTRSERLSAEARRAGHALRDLARVGRRRQGER